MVNVIGGAGSQVTGRKQSRGHRMSLTRCHKHSFLRLSLPVPFESAQDPQQRLRQTTIAHWALDLVWVASVVADLVTEVV
jgi:hypothetical protein